MAVHLVPLKIVFFFCSLSPFHFLFAIPVREHPNPDLLRFVLNVRQGSSGARAPAGPQPQPGAVSGAAAVTSVPVSAPSPSPNGAVPAVVPASASDPYGQLFIEASNAQTKASPPTTTPSPPPTTTQKAPSCGPDVLFVLDSTGSVRTVYNNQRRYILELAQEMDIGPDGQHVGLIIYSSKLRQRIVVGLDEPISKERFLNTVNGLPYHGGITATGSVLGLATKALAKRRPEKHTLVVVLTDGYTYDDWEAPNRALHSVGVDVIVVGDVQFYLRPILDQIAGDPSRVMIGEANKAKALKYIRCK